MLNIFKQTNSYMKTGVAPFTTTLFFRREWLELFLIPTKRTALMIGQQTNSATHESAQINLATFINKIDPSRTNEPLVTETFKRLTKKYPLYNKDTNVTTTTDKIERGRWQRIWFDIGNTYSYNSSLAGNMLNTPDPEYVGPSQLKNYLKNLYSDPTLNPNLIGGKHKHKSKKSKKSKRKSRKNKRKTKKH
jgi:hypothetical protein